MPAAPPDLPDARALAAWILQEGLYGTHFETLISDLCDRLVAQGVPLLRVNFTMRAHHPRVEAFAYRWRRQTGVELEQFTRRAGVSTIAGTNVEWAQSPLKALLDSPANELRHRLDPAPDPLPFPMFADLIALRATDYFATQVPFTRDSNTQLVDARNMPAGMMISWTSDAPEGFSDRDLDMLRALLPPLGLALKSAAHYKMAEDLLSVYLGGDAGTRVMSGEIDRGSLDKIRATMLYFDLRGFTRLSETLEPEALIEMLNDYFGGVVGIIHAHRGNVLKFMGDGLLAVFTERGAGRSRLDAIDAVAGIRADIDAINARRAGAGLPVTGFSAALHGGEVLYGNIGGPDRLDFTVIGPAVNAAARIQGMCNGLDQQILISAVVAEPALEQRPDLVSVGIYRLRGVADRVELFTLD